ncbi:hypothetical protein [Enterococcus sp. BWR-S5]|nr:hypothetical protein [Enterococcus sp. BWR-S5]MBL1223883.1 hypothetical protein [Enterococcus sp. BWR-S5]
MKTEDGDRKEVQKLEAKAQVDTGHSDSWVESGWKRKTADFCTNFFFDV